MILSSLDILLGVLTFFSTIIGTILVLVLMRVFKILGVVQELTGYYTKVKKMIAGYSQIPEGVKQSVKDLVSKK